MDAIVEYNYMAQEPDELTLRKGDIVKEIKVIPGGWWEGTLKDKRGMFPDNFVKVIEPSPSGNGQASKSEAEGSGTIKKEEISLRNGSSNRKYCKVLFSYEPCNDDELALNPQESIEFLGEIEEGWWRGRLRGCTGVFPSNFVTPPCPEEAERPIERETKEFCQVLFPYEANNEDELTLAEGEIVTLLSREVADKGWWKGELRGKTGLFPDNFVELLYPKNDQETSQSQSQSKASGMRHTYTGKKSEKAHARKSLDSRAHTTMEATMKKMASSASSTISSSSSLSSSQLISPGDKKSLIGNHSIVSSSLKRMVEKASDDLLDTGDCMEAGLNEELDGVERGEGAPLSHLTASRAKAPRRRLPSSQHFRGQANNNSQSSNIPSLLLEDNLTNGSIDTTDQFREDEGDGVVSKARRKAPWIEELKINQMEKRKTVTNDKIDKPEIKKERGQPRPQVPEIPPKTIHDVPLLSTTVELRQKDKDKEQNLRTESTHVTCPVSPTTAGNTPAYVPYRLYSQLLERVVVLEEKHTVLQRTVAQLSEKLNTSPDKL